MLTALGNALHFAGISDAQSPAKQIERFMEPKHNSRWFSDELLEFILATVQVEQTRAILNVLASFGLRHSELKRLTETDIDWTGARNGGRPTVMIRRPPGSKLGKPVSLRGTKPEVGRYADLWISNCSGKTSATRHSERRGCAPFRRRVMQGSQSPMVTCAPTTAGTSA
jgi:integrase